MYDFQKVRKIYREDYAEQYENLYLYPWPEKHKTNLINLNRICSELAHENLSWLDLFCGQAWHFASVPNAITKVGIDISTAQLKRAKIRNPDALFIEADVLEVSLNENAFDLVTAFWGAYCYLNSLKQIETLLGKAVSWTKTGGTLYFELLLPEDLKTFNASLYAQQTGFAVIPRQRNFSEWAYQDIGGLHVMTSPPLEFFTSLLAKHFQQIETKHDAGFMVHLIATNKI
jgi:ubiquinone/menaquinone biosynthesis C-methylase UbiE